MTIDIYFNIAKVKNVWVLFQAKFLQASYKRELQVTHRVKALCDEMLGFFRELEEVPNVAGSKYRGGGGGGGGGGGSSGLGGVKTDTV